MKTNHQKQRSRFQALSKFEDSISECSNCTLCEISKLTAQKVVYRYEPKTRFPVNPLLIIGEAPGESENLVGLPFVGASGKLLDRLLDDAGITEYVITNAILCTPFDDESRMSIRAPNKQEIKNCVPNLLRFTVALKPKAILTLGKVADQAYSLFQKYSEGVTKGVTNLPYINAYHPSFILRKGGSGTVEYKRTLLNLIDFRDQFLL